MKKLFALTLAVLTISVMGISVFAAKGGFLYSPTVNPVPSIEDFEHDDRPGEIVITPYGDRDDLDDESAKDLEDAYEDILNTKEGDDLYELLDGNLVSDLFNIGITGHDGNDDSNYTVQLSSDTFKNFADLLHYQDGKWIKVDGATVNDKGYLTFTYDKTGTFAVVVGNSDVQSPVTGDNGFGVFCIVMMIVSAVGFAGASVAANKKSAAHN